MDLKDLGEFGLINRLTRGAITRAEPGQVGIGDDCAVFHLGDRGNALVTTDMLVEEIHFDRSQISPRQLGHKAISVNLSDIAACGGIPREAFVSAAIAHDESVDFLDELFAGLREQAHDFEVNILGGDTTGSPGPLVLNITVVGRPPARGAVLRSGAVEGDLIMLTGSVGDAAAGLEIIRYHLESAAEYSSLVSAHHDPRPHVDEGRVIGEAGVATAMIDLSDGLAADLGHLCCASGVGAKIYWDKIPRSSRFRNFVSTFSVDERRLALAGGEDYVLLLTIAGADRSKLAELLLTTCNIQLSEIGVITSGPTIELVFPDGTTHHLAADGWDHFRL